MIGSTNKHRAAVIQSKFFDRLAVKVAKELLGKYLVCRVGGKIISGMITETEAYQGFNNKASHASRGITKRNFPMFGPAGRWYVYFVYGTHWMLNVVCGPKNYPAAVLIRAVVIPRLRSGTNKFLVAEQSRSATLLNGPAKLTKFFKIDKRFNNLPASRKTGLWIESPPKTEIKNLKLKIKNSPRVGVSYAGPVWSKKHWRFYIERARLTK